MTPQQTKVLGMLKRNGKVSNAGFVYSGIFSYTQRISELRKKGYNIRCNQIGGSGPSVSGTRWYRLEA